MTGIAALAAAAAATSKINTPVTPGAIKVVTPQHTLVTPQGVRVTPVTSTYVLSRQLLVLDSRPASVSLITVVILLIPFLTVVAVFIF